MVKILEFVRFRQNALILTIFNCNFREIELRYRKPVKEFFAQNFMRIQKRRSKKDFET